MPWNSPGNNNEDPWNRNSNNQGPPDLDEIFQKLSRKFGGIFGGSGGGGSSSGGNASGIGVFAIIVAAIIWAWGVIGNQGCDPIPAAMGEDALLVTEMVRVRL